MDDHEEGAFFWLPYLPFWLSYVCIIGEGVARLNDEGVNMVGYQGFRKIVPSENVFF